VKNKIEVMIATIAGISRGLDLASKVEGLNPEAVAYYVLSVETLDETNLLLAQAIELIEAGMIKAATGMEDYAL
jgi:hypothetical protein